MSNRLVKWPAYFPLTENEIVDENTFLPISQNAISVLFFRVRRDACRQF